MPFKSDKQRKAFFARQGNVKSNIIPTMVNKKTKIKKIVIPTSATKLKKVDLITQTIGGFTAGIISSLVISKRRRLIKLSDKKLLLIANLKQPEKEQKSISQRLNIVIARDIAKSRGLRLKSTKSIK